MALDTKVVTEAQLADLIKALSDKNAEQALLIYNDVNKNTESIKAEKDRAIAIETTLTNNLTAEANRAKNAELQIKADLESAANTLKISYSDEDLKLDSAIKKEITDRTNAIDATKQLFESKINSLDKAITDVNSGAIAKQITNVKTELLNHIDTADTLLNTAIEREASDRLASDIETNNRVTQINSDLNSKIDANNATISSISSKLDPHIASKENPHMVTAEQIGAAEKTYVDNKFQSIDSTIGSTNQYILDRIGSFEPGQLQNDLSDLKTKKLDKVGNSELIGSLAIKKDLETEDQTANGDLTVEGDAIIVGNLIVSGTTVTKNQEAITVEDNFIHINNGGYSGSAGISISIDKDQNKAYGIVYDPNSDSVNLGYGSLSENNFEFDPNESNPILTRQLTPIEDKHLLMWDAATHTAIDAGEMYGIENLRKEFATWDTQYKLATDILELSNTDTSLGELGRVTKAEAIINNHSQDIQALYSENDMQDSAIAENSNKIDLRQLKLDPDIKFGTKVVSESLNSLYDHTQDKNNPHAISWNQITAQGNVLSNTTPNISTTNGSAGSSSLVARADHAHPTDISRAPVNHASGSTQYGQATSTEYGHVIVDDQISTTSINPAQNKVVAEYVDNKITSAISDIKHSEIKVKANQTIKSISQENGILTLEIQDITVDSDQVDVQELNTKITALESDLTDLSNNLNQQLENQNTEIQNTKTLVESNIEATNKLKQDFTTSLNEEQAIRTSIDTQLQNNIEALSTRLTSEVASTQDKINAVADTVDTAKAFTENLNAVLDKVETGLISPDQVMVLGFVRNSTDTAWEVAYVPLEIDDGILG